MPQTIEEITLSDAKQQAIDWLITLRSDDISDEELQNFAEWLAQDHAHSEAFAEAENLFDDMSMAANFTSVHGSTFESKENDLSQPTTSLTKNQSTRRWYTPALAIAACWITGIVLFFPPQTYWWLQWISDYHTQTGELKEVILNDGSRLLLDSNSAVSIVFEDTIRNITLHTGRVQFTVADDSERPFSVTAGNWNIKALGTVFQVFKKNGNISIAVQEHSVSISSTSTASYSTASTGTIINNGQQLLVNNDILSTPTKAEMKQLSAWQQQRLIVNDRPLSDLIEELEYYHNIHIILADSTLTDLRVTGVFSITNAKEVILTICQALNLEQNHIGAWWWLSQH